MIYVNYYYLEYSDSRPHLYFYNNLVSVDVSFGLLQVFHGEFESSHRISNLIIYLNHRGTIYQPLRSGRIWHKVNFLSGV